MTTYSGETCNIDAGEEGWDTVVRLVGLGEPVEADVGYRYPCLYTRSTREHTYSINNDRSDDD